MTYFIGLLIILGVVVALLKLSMAKAKATTVNIEGRPILTANELQFFLQLERALPHLHVFPQVAANALLKAVPGGSKQAQHATRNRFAQKHVDFVLCERITLSVKAIIELDDKTHRPDKDRKRDSMFEMGGYTVHRFDSRHKPTDVELIERFGAPKPPVLHSEPNQW